MCYVDSTNESLNFYVNIPRKVYYSNNFWGTLSINWCIKNNTENLKKKTVGLNTEYFVEGSSINNMLCIRTKSLELLGYKLSAYLKNI